MIKITDGTTEKVVTKGMFDSLYSRLGYRLVEDKKPSVDTKEDKKEIVEEEVKGEEKREVKKTSRNSK